MVAAVFMTSGWSQMKDPVAKGKQNEVSPGLTRFVGTAEVLGGLGVLTGVLAQLAAVGLILIMAGSIKKKIVNWHTGFWQGQSGVELRPHVRAHEPGDRDDRGRPVRASLAVLTPVYNKANAPRQRDLWRSAAIRPMLHRARPDRFRHRGPKRGRHAGHSTDRLA